MLADIFNSNSDGIGYMYGSKKGLKVIKSLPHNIKQAADFIQRIPNDDRDFAIHFRMTTHGHTDLGNCHPYDVVPGYMAMMHNGILSTGNAADKAKSDTWHFIKDYIASPVKDFPELAYNESYLKMLAEMIGNNRFVFMNGEGRMSHVNYDQGIEYDGLWFSNTYAWTPSMLIPTYKKPSMTYPKHMASWKYGEDDDSYGDYTSALGYKSGYSYDSNSYKDMPSGSINKETRTPRAHEAGYNEDAYAYPETMLESDAVRYAFEEAVLDVDVVTVTAMLDAYPYILEGFLSSFRAVPPKGYKATDYTKRDAALIDALYDEDIDMLVAFLKVGELDSCTTLAEAMCYYMTWVESAMNVV